MASDDIIGQRTFLELSADDCLRLLGQVPVGRLVFLDGRQPVALPVNHAVHRAAVVFKTPAGSRIDRARQQGGPVAFEVDDFQRSAPFAGWSVLVKGAMELVSDEGERDALDAIGLYSWLPDLSRRHWVRNTASWEPMTEAHWIRLRAEEITGRRTERG